MRMLKDLNLTTKIITVAIGLLLVVTAISYTMFMRGYADDARHAMTDRAAAFTAVADEAKNHASKLVESQSFDAERLVSDALAHMRANGPDSYSETEFFDTIPVIVGWKAAAAAAEREQIEFGVIAFESRNPENEPAAGTFRAQLLSDLTKQVKDGGEEMISRIDESTNTLHYLRAIRLDESCLSCHGDPGHPFGDPDGDGKDLLGFRMEGWEAGYMHGAYAVAMPLDPVDAQVAGFLTNGLMVMVPVVLVGAGLFVVVLRALLTRPITALVATVKDVATGDGDLTKRVGSARSDEIGQLGKWVDVFLENIQKIITDVKRATGEVSGASTEIAASAEEMAAGMNEQQRQTDQVSAAIEEMSQSVREVAQQSSDAVNVAQQSGKEATDGGGVVRDTVQEMHAIADQVRQSASTINALGGRAEAIGEVVSVIQDIADQTNLLALNAAIEAARAGEHGRGFAVVADEVRKLAERTTEATEEVRKSISEIQRETEAAVGQISNSSDRVQKGVDLATVAGDALDRIVQGSNNVQALVQAIAAAAEEQSAASEEIARAVENINSVTRESAQGADQSAQAASGLSVAAERLEGLVNRFRI